MLLLGAGEALAGPAGDVNADTIGCFNKAIGNDGGAIWYLSDSNNPASPVLWTEFGGQGAGVRPVVGKFDGSNAFGLGVADASTSPVLFWGTAPPTPGAASTATHYAELPVEASAATTNDPIPLTGNWMGNGRPGVGLYYPDIGQFVLDSDPGFPTEIPFFEYGPKAPNDVVPIVGDFNGDGNDTVGIYYRPHGRFFLTKNVMQTPGGTQDEINLTQLNFFFGPPGDNWIPIAGDWDLQGGDSIGLYDPDTGTFYLRNSNTSGVADITVTYNGGLGSTTDCIPVAGNWNIPGLLP